MHSAYSVYAFSLQCIHMYSTCHRVKASNNGHISMFMSQLYYPSIPCVPALLKLIKHSTLPLHAHTHTNTHTHTYPQHVLTHIPHTHTHMHTHTHTLVFVHNHVEIDYEALRTQHPTETFVKVFTFNSARKSMSTVIPLEGGGYRLLTKGASEIILYKCTQIMGNEGEVKALCVCVCVLCCVVCVWV